VLVQSGNAHDDAVGWLTNLGSMLVRSCKVTILDVERIAHSVSNLYEATAIGLKAIPDNPWVMGISEQFNSVKIEVKDIAVEHTVKLKVFTAWLDRNGNNPKKMMDRRKIREIPGLSLETSRKLDGFLRLTVDFDVRQTSMRCPGSCPVDVGEGSAVQCGAKPRLELWVTAVY
jgi:hypothetical protein